MKDALTIDVVVSLVVVLALNAIGLERDHQASMDDACRAYGKTYSHQHRTCVRPQR